MASSHVTTKEITQTIVASKQVIELTLTIPEAQILRDLLSYTSSVSNEENYLIIGIWGSLVETNLLKFTKGTHSFKLSGKYHV